MYILADLYIFIYYIFVYPAKQKLNHLPSKLIINGQISVRYLTIKLVFKNESRVVIL